jgi:hypothetical protein
VPLGKMRSQCCEVPRRSATTVVPVAVILGPRPPQGETTVPSDQTAARSLHDLGAAAWFGGALMGATGLAAAAEASRSTDRIRVADAGWQTWRPWKRAAITAHVAGSLALVWGNKGRLTAERGAMSVNLVKTGVFAAALGADVYAAALGRRVSQQRSELLDAGSEARREAAPAEEAGLPPQSGSEAHTGHEGAASTERRLRAVQWAVVALTGLNIAIGAKMGEQQRPTTLARGVLARLDPRR